MTAGCSMPATIRIVSPQAGLVIDPTIRLRFCAQMVGEAGKALELHDMEVRLQRLEEQQQGNRKQW